MEECLLEQHPATPMIDYEPKQPVISPHLPTQSEAASQRAAVAELLNVQVKLINALYDKAAAYTNLIMIAGYAGFFGIWQMAKDHLGASQVLWSALLMLASVSVFVAFEVYKIITTARQQMARSEELYDERNHADVDRLLAKLNELAEATHKWAPRFAKVWLFVLVSAIGTAVTATGILAYALIAALATPGPSTSVGKSDTVQGPATSAASAPGIALPASGIRPGP